MSTVSTLPGGRGLVAVKGAPETLKTMLAHVPSDYDETYKWYTRRGSRVLALGMKEYDSISMDRVCIMAEFFESALTAPPDQEAEPR
jgi:cation-transporting ATPase 13A1